MSSSAYNPHFLPLTRASADLGGHGLWDTASTERYEIMYICAADPTEITLFLALTTCSGSILCSVS